MDTSEQFLRGGTAVIIPGQMAYVKLPADAIRKFADRMFPQFAKCPDADFMKGYGHRWAGGHDLLVDVPNTLVKHGPLRSIRHAGHIVLTDLPTKDGIPIPGLSDSGFGQWLVDAGIPKGYLSIHWADGCLGFLSIAEGSTDLIQAIHGTLVMNSGTFYDTFGEGGMEIAISLALESVSNLAKFPFNPAFAMFGAAENILAGIISTYQTLSVYVDPLDFFGSAGMSALIGFGLSYGLAGKSLSSASIDGVRSGVVGAFFSMSPMFGFGAMAGFVSFKLGKALAEKHNASMNGVLKIDENAYNLLLDEMCKGNIHLADFLERAEYRITFSDATSTLPTQSDILKDNIQILPDSLNSLDSDSCCFSEKTEHFKVNLKTLSDKSPVLSDRLLTVLS
jgi:hypothetical protein